MSALSMARRGYSAASVPTKTSKSIEYDAIARISQRLKMAAQQGPSGFPELAAALHDNRRLWTIFATQVSDADNPLPRDLKARLFYLSEFTAAHTSKVLNRTAPVGPLLEVNAAVLRGLRGGKS
ncbi:flagellar biosynthesis regulator FlaF [Seohaeicola saemankumensis]|nr:flagellar biosynthesis regulator FlaF [Seohaeicola saemankumensis]MCA0870376.1 flagellar biosynthesis regulator FlaF [Seohaeicola saemankumensis]